MWIGFILIILYFGLMGMLVLMDARDIKKRLDILLEEREEGEDDRRDA